MNTQKHQQDPSPLQIHLANACHSFKQIELQLNQIAAKSEQVSNTMKALRKKLESNHPNQT